MKCFSINESWGKYVANYYKSIIHTAYDYGSDYCIITNTYNNPSPYIHYFFFHKKLYFFIFRITNQIERQKIRVSKEIH
ncbi:hypothetical protein JHK87_009079 [Glycine soja]|nr:hypothetical protein JHK87_009079 [Glycine soja]